MMIDFHALPEEIRKLYNHDATVRAYLTYAMRDRLDYKDTLEKLVVQLAMEKKAAIDKAVEISQTTLLPRVFMHSQDHKQD
jgi:hypothetical protein